MLCDNSIDACNGPALCREDGWKASLELEIVSKNGKSVVAKSRQQGPLTIQKPFFPEGDLCHIYLIHPPAGIVGGDQISLRVTSSQNSSALFTTPGATKFYRTNGRQALQQQHFRIETGSSFEWLPQETIYFPMANARLETRVELENKASFIGWEIHCLGLPANGKDLGDGKARVGLQIIKEGRPVLFETLRIAPEKRSFDAAFLKDNQIFGSFISTGANELLLKTLRRLLPKTTEGLWGATLVEDILILRYLGKSTSEARKLFFKAWTITRPEVLGRTPFPPRIWAT